VLVLDDLDAVDNFHEASLELLGLSGGGGGGQLNDQGSSAETDPSSYDVGAIGGTATTPTKLLRAVYGCVVGVHSLYQCLSRVLAHLLNLLAASARAHGPGVAIVVLLLLELDVGAVARYYDGAARLAAAQARPRLQGRVGLGLVLLAHRGTRRGGRHVVGVGQAAGVVLGGRRVGCEGDLGREGHPLQIMCGSVGVSRVGEGVKSRQTGRLDQVGSRQGDRQSGCRGQSGLCVWTVGGGGAV
jgi:hypothetical protein